MRERARGGACVWRGEARGPTRIAAQEQNTNRIQSAILGQHLPVCEWLVGAAVTVAVAGPPNDLSPSVCVREGQRVAYWHVCVCAHACV